jgi:hypothetical protein
MMEPLDLLREWSNWVPNSPPYVLPADRSFVLPLIHTSAVRVARSWRQFYTDPDTGRPTDTAFHLGLLPQPFKGDLMGASIYILMLNPSVGPHDYYAEYEVPSFRRAMMRSLKLSPRRRSESFLFLNPKYSWHGGFAWWHAKLAQVIEHLSLIWRVSFSEARARLAKQIACIDLIPYHSSSFRDPGHWSQNLHSALLARSFVSGYVLPRIRKREAIAIVTRKAKVWSLPRIPGVVVYSPTEARSAHLTPNSPGGKAILRHLLRARSLW